MLDMGFEKDVRTIIAATPASRKTVMFTATWCGPTLPCPKLELASPPLLPSLLPSRLLSSWSALAEALPSEVRPSPATVGAHVRLGPFLKGFFT